MNPFYHYDVTPNSKIRKNQLTKDRLDFLDKGAG